MNTMACEQTVAWISRYKKMYNAKNSPPFIIYTEWSRGKFILHTWQEPVQPRVRHAWLWCLSIWGIGLLICWKLASC